MCIHMEGSQSLIKQGIYTISYNAPAGRITECLTCQAAKTPGLPLRQSLPGTPGRVADQQ